MQVPKERGSLFPFRRVPHLPEAKEKGIEQRSGGQLSSHPLKKERDEGGPFKAVHFIPLFAVRFAPQTLLPLDDFAHRCHS